MSYPTRDDALAAYYDHFYATNGSDGAEQPPSPLTVGSGEPGPSRGLAASGPGISDNRVVYICLGCETGLSGFAAASEHSQLLKHATLRLVLHPERRRGRRGEGHQVKWSSPWVPEVVADDL